jgi:hypothetical protein
MTGVEQIFLYLPASHKIGNETNEKHVLKVAGRSQVVCSLALPQQTSVQLKIMNNNPTHG